MGFRERLEARAEAVDSMLCVGLDPHPDDVTGPGELVAWCRRLMEATAASAVAFKPNVAFFEAWGPAGLEALEAVIREAPPGPLVILDAKRGDIASTAAAYARAAFERLGADAITLHPWMGADSLAPFLTDPQRGVFVLARTSNPGGADLQDLPLRDGRRGYEAVADLAGSLGPNVGVVVGATKPGEIAAVRARLPDAWILAPGVGAQGGDLAATVAAGARADGRGLLINVSRGLSRAADPGAEAVRLVAAMRAARDAAAGAAPADVLADRVADGLLRMGCVRLGEFTLKSGLKSPIYLDLRRLTGDAALLADVGALMARSLRGLKADVIAALPYAAMPIGTALSLCTGLPMVYPRKEVKAYGTKAAVEGVYSEGQTAVVVDDLATTGLSKLEGIERLQAAGLVVTDIVVLVDRESGAGPAMAEAGYRLHAAFTITELLARWERSGAVTAAQADEIRAFLVASWAG